MKKRGGEDEKRGGEDEKRGGKNAVGKTGSAEK